MTAKKDITGPDQVRYIELTKTGLVYTDNLGWIDLGHANPAGAQSLWRQMTNPARINSDYFLVVYRQSMSRRLIAGSKSTRLTTLVSKSSFIKRGLHIEQLIGIAYAIFLDTSHNFESLQHSFPYNLITDSGYSAEDLISNILGFHSAVYGENYIQRIEFRDSDYALKIWDYYGPVGSYKNNELKPLIFPDPEDPTLKHVPYKKPLPNFLSRLKPITDKNLVTERRM